MSGYSTQNIWQCPSDFEDERALPKKPIVGSTTFDEFAIIFSGACGLFAIIVSTYLIFKHALAYSKPEEQKHIIRIPTMLICFSLLSFVGTWLSRHDAVYIDILMDLYESVIFGSFFLLAITWFRKGDQSVLEKQVSQSPERNFDVSGATMPPPPLPEPYRENDQPLSGKYYVLIFQFPGVMFFLTLVTEVSNAFGHYCVSSSKPRYAHFWVSILRFISTTMALTAIVILTHKKKYLARLKGFHPRRKFWTFKSIVGLRLKQQILFAFLLSSDVVSPSKYLSSQDIGVAIPAMVLCGEMVIWSLLFLWAYPTTPYKIPKDISRERQAALELGPDGQPLRYQGGFLGLRAILDAANVVDVLKEALLWPRFLCR